MPKKKKQSAVQQAYNKELRRIKQFINRAEKRGYLIPENIIPKRPKRITSRSVESLRKINPEKIYKKSRFVDTETGEILKGLAGREYERSKSAKKAAKTRKSKKKAEQDFWSGGGRPITPEEADIIRGQNAVEMIRDRLSAEGGITYETYGGQIRRRQKEVVKAVNDAKNKLLSMFERMIEQEGIEAIGKRLNQYAEQITEILDMLSYASKSVAVYSATSQLIQILTAGNMSITDLASADIIDEYEDGLDVI